MQGLWKACLKALLQLEKNAWTLNSQIPMDNTEGSRDFFDSEEFVNP